VIHLACPDAALASRACAAPALRNWVRPRSAHLTLNGVDDDTSLVVTPQSASHHVTHNERKLSVDVLSRGDK
jgi:hypothetical protein